MPNVLLVLGRWTTLGVKAILPLLATLILPIQLNGDCGSPLEFYGYAFLNPAIARMDARFAPYLGGFETIYRQLKTEGQDVVQQKDNLQEWHERYCENVAIKDLETLIYGRSENRLKELQQKIAMEETRLADLSPTLRQNSFARHLLKYRCSEVVDYLIYAKKIEPFVVAPKNSFTTKPPEGNAMKRLVEEGLARFPSVESHYLRLRYAYQLLRLSHYRGDYAHVVELYDYLMPKIDADPSLIYHWLNGHYAGALLQLGQRAKAAYLFSRIFIECPSKRESAYRSFSVKTDEEWQELLNFCNSDQERADLYVLRAHNDRARLLPEMRAIYGLDPDNKGLEMLLVREMQVLEKEFLANDINPNTRRNRSLGIPRENAPQRLIDLQDFVLQVTKAGNTGNPQLWELASGYLYLLAGDFHYARQQFWTIGPEIKNDTLKQQLHIFQRVMDILAISQLNDSLENKYFATLQQAPLLEKYPDLDNLIYDKFREVYKDNNQKGKAFLLTHKLEDLRYHLDIGLITDFRQLAADTNDNSFERRLLLDRGGPNAINDLIDMEATYYLQRGQVKLANKIFRELPPERWDDYGNYPAFLGAFSDKVNRRISDTVPVFNKAQLFQRIIDLEDQAELSTDPARAAELYFGVGLAYYNMSYFGYNWRAADYYRSGTSAVRAANGQGKNYVFSTRLNAEGNFEHMSMEMARYYFEQSRRKATTSLEQGARATYWAAKTERNQYYADGKPGGKRPFAYFSLLADYYNETDYYQKAVDECRTFAWFVGK